MGFSSLLEDLLKKCEELDIPESTSNLNTLSLDFYNHSITIRKEAVNIINILNKEKYSKRGSRIFEKLKNENKLKNIENNFEELKNKYEKLKKESAVKNLKSLNNQLVSKELEIQKLKSQVHDTENKIVSLNAKLEIKKIIEQFNRNSEDKIKFIDDKLGEIYFISIDLENSNLNISKSNLIEKIVACIDKLKEINNQ